MTKESPDKEWHVERKRGEINGGMNINHKGLMPRCFNCNTSYKMVPVDKKEFSYKAEHGPGSCPFGQDFYGVTDIECVTEIRRYNERMLEVRNKNVKG
jgi:hypothetical protein